MMYRSTAGSWFTVMALLICESTVDAADFLKDIRPVLAEYCITCHSTEKQKGDLDLERFTSMELVQRDPIVWQHALEQIRDGEMPPKDKPQPSAEQMKVLTLWMQETLDNIAIASAGDPGPVVLRRLSNMEYTYTIRDLSGVESLDPAKEFPIDGAAGEGFTNAGAALVMSPSLLTKYLDAAKEIANHAVLTPDGMRFSPNTSSRDWTNESLAKIRSFYALYSGGGTGTAVNLQGIQFDTNADGRLPVGKYLTVAMQERIALTEGTKSIADVAKARVLSEKYLGLLWSMLHDTKPSLLLDSVRAKWHAGTLAEADIQAWQKSLWRFTSVGHLGKVGGPKSWMEPVTPLATQTEVRLKLAAPADGSDATLYLSTGDAGDGSEHDFVLWENARLVAPSRKDLPLRNVRAVLQQLTQRRGTMIASVDRCLAAATEAEYAKERTQVAKLAEEHDVDPQVLAGWLDYLGIGSSGEVQLGPLLTNKMMSTPDYNFIKGWTGADALSVLANSSDTAVRVPGQMKAHSIAAHPSPTLAAVIGWRSPVAGELQIEGSIQHAHSECGNGITWALELRRGHTRQVLGSGLSSGANVVAMGRMENIRVLPGDVVAVVIGPRDGNHSCDLTAVDLILNDGNKEWNLANDNSPDILAGNPHADSYGNRDVWTFFGEPATSNVAPKIPAGSLLAQWRASSDVTQRKQLAKQVQQLLQQEPAAIKAESPDKVLYSQLLSLNGPLLSAAMQNVKADDDDGSPSPYGLDPSVFGIHPISGDINPTSLCVQSPSVIEVRFPASLVDGAEFVANCRLDTNSGAEGSVQAQVLTVKPTTQAGLRPSDAKTVAANGAWTSSNPAISFESPIIVNDGSVARKRFETAFDEFRQLFPAALCYTKIVPVDEVVTLTLFHREDEPLARLMLNDEQQAELDRQWDELHFVSQDALTLVDAYEQIWQFSTQDGPNAPEGDKRLAPLRAPIMQGAELFKQQLIDAQPSQVKAVLNFATQAWRRPLTGGEQSELLSLYRKLRKQELPHESAVRMLIARVLVSPAFLYRGEKALPGTNATPVDDWELATRLSYFLWSSAPDEELRSLAAAGMLNEPKMLVAQARRMLRAPKVRRLATEFGCQWLHVRDLENLDEKSERHFPTFASLRGAMQEEVVRFFIDLCQENRSVLSLLDADTTFVNGPLAKHYGIDLEGDEWQRVDGLRAKGRGGILGFASTLAKQSGASRTSPILRGNWLSEVVLGEKLPRPPKDVPVLPDEAPTGLTERQLIERHSSDARCAGCHRRIDPFGFALEGFDAIGRIRTQDSAGLRIDTRTHLPNGDALEGLDGLRTYLLTTRREDFLRQFCKKLLGYALGRSVQLSDKPLIESMLAQLKSNDYHVFTALELIVCSPQFREVRGRDFLISH